MTPGEPTAIAVTDLAVRHATTAILGPLSFAVPHGTTLGVWGPSGIGKSTLLRALTGLLPDSLDVSGRVRVLGEDPHALPPARLADLRARAVLVGQEPVVFPGSIMANAMFGLRHVVKDTGERLRARALRALEDAGLRDEVCERLDADAGTLSVGQRQRLCLARALALEPAVLLLDEPTSALDPRSRAEVQRALEHVRRDHTIVLVSHDRAQIDALADATLDLSAWHKRR